MLFLTSFISINVSSILVKTISVISVSKLAITMGTLENVFFLILLLSLFNSVFILETC